MKAERRRAATKARGEEPLNRDNAFIIAALSFIPRRRGGGPLSFALSRPTPPRPLCPSYPFLFTLFCPQRIHCRRVVGGYRQPVGISVSTRQKGRGMDEFCKSPFFLSVLCRFLLPSANQRARSPALLKGRNGPPLFSAGASIMCASGG